MWHVRYCRTGNWWRRWSGNSNVLDLRSLGRGFESHRGHLCNNLGQVVCTYVPLSPSSISWYRLKDGDVLRPGRWPQAWRKVMAAYRLVHEVICGLTACTPGSAPGPTFGNEYGRIYLFYLLPSLYTVSWKEIRHLVVALLSAGTPEFISPQYRPPNSQDFDPVDSAVWGILQQRVYRCRILARQSHDW